MVKINNSISRAEELIIQNRKKHSKTESLVTNKAVIAGTPEVTNRMARSVSDERRQILEMEIEAGDFREKGSSGFFSSSEDENGYRSIRDVQTQLGIVSHNGKKLFKIADGSPAGGVLNSGSAWRGSNSTGRQMPEIYSPLWLNSNLSLPRDRPTINAWSRSFFALNPIVHNAITLHSTYPIAKLNIKSKNPKVEKFFSQMIDEIDLMNIAVMAAQEYWILGEAFIYGELDESKGSWSRLMILNPDYVNVQRSVIAAEPIISLRPDENLRRVIQGNQPSDIQQRKQLDPSIIEHVKRNENIPLNNFYVHHMARRISPYEIRGTGLIVSCFRALMLADKLRECYSTDHEVLTKEGFKRIDEITEISTDIKQNPSFVNGIEVDERGGVTGVLTLKKGIEIACFNPDTESVEYHEPEELHMSKYTGKMLHFTGKKVDALVSPNHKMWVSKKVGNEYGEYKKVNAKDIEKKKLYKLQGTAKWNGTDVSTVKVGEFNVPIDMYLKLIGCVISEGCVDTKSSDCVGDIKDTMNKFASHTNYSISEIVNIIKNQIGFGGKCDSRHKRVPRWVMDLPISRLNILLQAMVVGGGNVENINDGYSYKYSTVCKELADDVQEILFKCGYPATIKSRQRKTCVKYTVSWSDNIRGKQPIIYHNGSGASINEVDYDGVVWCFTVPTGLFITRRNNVLNILGNSKYVQADNMVNPLTLVKIGDADFRPSPVDLEHWRNTFEEAEGDRNFKIFSHNAVDIQRVGWGQGIYDTSADVTQAIKETYIGLMVPSVIMDGSDTTYATGSVALDVLRQRYMQFRQMMTNWLKRKIFAPISQIQDFYEYIDGEKTLIIPEIDWNHMSLFDMDTYIQNMISLSTGEGTQKRVSLQTTYRGLGLEYEEEQKKIRYEDIQDAIRTREIAAMARYSIHELKSLSPGDEIEEVQDEPVPGQSPYKAPDGSAAPPGGMPGISMGPGPGAPKGPPMPGAPPPMPIGGGGAPPPSGGGQRPHG